MTFCGEVAARGWALASVCAQGLGSARPAARKQGPDPDPDPRPRSPSPPPALAQPARGYGGGGDAPAGGALRLEEHEQVHGRRAQQHQQAPRAARVHVVRPLRPSGVPSHLQARTARRSLGRCGLAGLTEPSLGEGRRGLAGLAGRRRRCGLLAARTWQTSLRSRACCTKWAASVIRSASENWCSADQACSAIRSGSLFFELVVLLASKSSRERPRSFRVLSKSISSTLLIGSASLRTCCIESNRARRTTSAIAGAPSSNSNVADSSRPPSPKVTRLSCGRSEPQRASAIGDDGSFPASAAASGFSASAIGRRLSSTTFPSPHTGVLIYERSALLCVLVGYRCTVVK